MLTNTRNYIHGRPLTFGDKGQISVIKHHEAKTMGEMLVATGEGDKIDPRDWEDRMDEKEVSYCFYCINSKCSSLLFKAVSHGYLWDNDYLLACSCGAQYSINNDLEIFVVPETLNQY